MNNPTANNQFKKAIRKQSKLRLGLCGVSGSGKTYTALRLAHSLGVKKIAVIDTERNSASLYANLEVDGVKWEFDSLELIEHSPDSFINAINFAKGYEVLIIDSFSHAWDGIKDVAEEGAVRFKGNTWAGWGIARPKERELFNAILQFDGHVIATMRAKTEWQIIDKKPVKIGLAPEQKSGIEYEFTIFIDMDTEHNAVITKSRCSELADLVINRPGQELASKILNWLNEGEDLTKILRSKIELLNESERTDFINRIQKKFNTSDIRVLPQDKIEFLLNQIGHLKPAA